MEAKPPIQAKAKRGIRCPACESRNISVRYTRHKQQSTRRARRCDDCGQGFLTVERVIGTKLPENITNRKEAE